MKKTEKRLLIFMSEMVAFCAMMFFGISYGPQHPQIFFWGVLTFFVIVIAFDIKPTLKDSIILYIGMIVLGIVATGVDKLVTHFFGRDTLIGLIANCVLLAPFYLPLIGHFLKVCDNRLKKEKELESESK